MKTTARLSTALLLGAALAVLVAPSTAGAHNDEANLSVESQTSTGPLSLELRISARYTDDDHLVDDIDLSVAGTGPDGATLASTPLVAVPDTVGLYGAELTFPVGGSWELAITSTDPEGTLNASVEVTDAEPSTTDTGDNTTTTAQPIGGAEGDVEDDPDLVPIVGGALVVLALAGVGTYVYLRRRGSARPETPGTPEI